MASDPVAATDVRVDPDSIRTFTSRLLESLDFTPEHAAIGAEMLVRTDLRGHHSHGLRYLPAYVPLIRGGAIRAGARPQVLRETSASAVLDGDAGLGHVVAHRATRLAIDKVRAGSAMAAVTVRNSNHFGAADTYAVQCAEAGLIGMVFTNATPGMSAPGSRGPVVSTSPIAYGVPSADGRHMVLDVALSVTAGSRVLMAAERGERIPEGWLTDRDGRPTTDPNELLRGGALAPIGGHKGWGLSLLVETLSGVLSGAGMLAEVLLYPAFPETPSGTGHAVIVLDPDAFLEPGEFGARLDRMRDAIHAAPRAEGSDRILVPGELELEHEAESLVNGLELDAFTWSTLIELARDAGLDDVLAGSRR
jgi:LDH2 family malate/lactate/ureidoglycolate dehydrogenase